MQQYDDMKQTLKRPFSRKVLETMVKFTGALGVTNEKKAVVHVRGIRDGPMELKMLDVSHVELVRITVQRSEKDNSEFVTAFDLGELDRYVKAVPKGKVIEVTMTSPLPSKHGAFYVHIQLEGAGVWTRMIADEMYIRSQEVMIPAFNIDYEIEVQNEDMRPAFHLFQADDLVALHAEEGDNYYLQAEDPKDDFLPTKGVILNKTLSKVDMLGSQHEWIQLKRTMKVFYQLGGRSSSTKWRGGFDKPLCIYWSTDEIKVETYFAPRIRVT